MRLNRSLTICIYTCLKNRGERMRQELYKFTRTPLFWFFCILLIALSVVQPMTSKYAKKDAVSLYRELYKGNMTELLDMEGEDWLEYQLSEEEYLIIEYYKQELEERENYTLFLDNLKQYVAGSTILFNSKTFLAKNASKELADYQPMDSIRIVDAPSLGVTQYCAVTWADYLLVIFGIFLCLYFITREKEMEILPLMKCTKGGFQLLFVRRLLVIFLVLFLVYITGHVGKLLVCKSLYGFGDVSRSVQSVYGLQNSVLTCNVGEFLFLTTAAQACAILMVVAVMFMVCTVFRKLVPTCAGMISIIIVETAFWLLIPKASILAPLKYINIVALLDAKSWIGNYLNLNFFTIPINRLPLSILFVVLVITAGFAMAWLKFADNVLKERWGKPKKLFKRERKLKPVRVSVHSLFFWENYKLLRLQWGAVVFFLLIVISILSYRPEDMYFFDVDEEYYKMYHEQLAGELTLDKEELIAKEEAEYDRIMNEYNIDTDNMMQQMMLDEIILAKMQGYDAFQRIYQVYEYIKESDAKEFVYDTAYSYLFTEKGRKQSLLLMGGLLLTVLVAFSGLVVNEKTKGMCGLIAATPKGRRKVNQTKLAGSICLYTAAFVIIYLPRIFALEKVYGFWGRDAPANSLMFLSWVPDGISVLMIMLLYHILLYLVGMCYLFYVFICSMRVGTQIESLAWGLGGAIVFMLLYAWILW